MKFIMLNHALFWRRFRVYNLNKKLWPSINYVIFLNSEFIWNSNRIKKLINFLAIILMKAILYQNNI